MICPSDLNSHGPGFPDSGNRHTPTGHNRLRNLNPNIGAFYFYGKTGLRQFGIQAVPSVRDIELPPMPRTSHNGATQLAFGQRPARVGTDAIQGRELTCNMKQGDNPVTGYVLFAGSFWNLVDRSDS